MEGELITRALPKPPCSIKRQKLAIFLIEQRTTSFEKHVKMPKKKERWSAQPPKMEMPTVADLMKLKNLKWRPSKHITRGRLSCNASDPSSSTLITTWMWRSWHRIRCLRTWMISRTFVKRQVIPKVITPPTSLWSWLCTPAARKRRSDEPCFQNSATLFG